MDRLTGIGVSGAVAVGRAVILTQRTEVMRFPIPPDRVEKEVQALHAAREQSKQQLQDISVRVAQGPGSELAALFDAQILMLDDEMLIGQAEKIIRTERVNAAWAVHRAYEGSSTVLDVEDPYLRGAGDVADVAGRLRANLRHGARGRSSASRRAARSDRRRLTASSGPLDWTRVRVRANAGSRTYHTAILALVKVPAIVGLHDAPRITGTPVVSMATGGLVISTPGRSRGTPPGRRPQARRHGDWGPLRRPTAFASGSNISSCSEDLIAE